VELKKVWELLVYAVRVGYTVATESARSHYW